MYIKEESKQALINACLSRKDYIYLEKITYLSGKISDFFLCVAFLFRYDADRNINYIEIITIKNKSKAICLSYVADTSKLIPINEQNTDNSDGLHCLYIIKELGFIALEYMIDDQLRFKVENPQLVRLYRSRRGFSTRLNVLADDTFYVNKSISINKED